MDESATQSSAQSERPHLATVSHDGRFWDVYIDFEDDAAHPESHRAALLFSPADGGESGLGPARTTVILIEESNEAIVTRARSFGEHQLSALLRSALS